MNFDNTKILESFSNLVGFKDSAKYPLPSDLKASESGLFYNSVHPQLTPAKLYSIRTDLNDTDATTDAEAYAEFLQAVRDAVILDIANKFVIEKIINKSTTPDPKFQRTLFRGAGNIASAVKGSGNFAGLLIRPIADKFFNLSIKKLGFQGTEAGVITIYLLNLGTQELIDFVDIDYTNPKNMQYFDVDFLLKSYDPDKGINGAPYFLCYDQDQYSGAAIGQNLLSCNSCSTTTDALTKIIYDKYMKIVPATHRNNMNGEIMQFSNLSYSTTDSFGLNVEISGGCDFTDLLIDNRQMFAPYLQYSVAMRLIEELLNNAGGLISRPNSNFNPDSLRLSMYGDGTGKNGLIAEKNAMFTALQISTEGITSVCLKCNNKGTLKVSYL